MTVLPQLKHDLYEAAARAQARDVEHRDPGVERRGAGSSRRGRRRSGQFAEAVPILLSAVLVVAIAAVAVVVFKQARASHAATQASTDHGSRRALMRAIGALRRDQTKANINSSVRRFVTRAFPLAPSGGPMSGALFAGEPDLPLVRYATTTAWGRGCTWFHSNPTELLVRVVHSRSCRGREGSFFSAGGASTVEVPETLAVVSAGGWLVGPARTAEIQAGHAGGVQPAGRRVLGGGISGVRFISIVPDGVATVAFVLPRGAIPGLPFERVYPSSLTAKVRVENNIAAVQVNRQYDLGGLPPMIW